MQTQQQFCSRNINNVDSSLYKSYSSRFLNSTPIKSLGFSIIYIKRMLGFTRAP